MFIDLLVYFSCSPLSVEIWSPSCVQYVERNDKKHSNSKYANLYLAKYRFYMRREERKLLNTNQLPADKWCSIHNHRVELGRKEKKKSIRSMKRPDTCMLNKPSNNMKRDHPGWNKKLALQSCARGGWPGSIMHPAGTASLNKNLTHSRSSAWCKRNYV